MSVAAKPVSSYLDTDETGEVAGMVDDAAAQADELARIAAANTEQSDLVEDIDTAITALRATMAAIDAE